MHTPIALIVFSRPGVTRRNLDVLREVRPSQLFVIGDGPRPGRHDEKQRCAEVRDLIETGIDWPCTVDARFAPTNLGLEANVELGLDWVFSQVGRAIVLEDDCIPHPTFFDYCEELLDRYADDRRVWQISGDRHGVDPQLFGRNSYAFTTWASVWGWATWADRWLKHREAFDRDHADAAERVGAIPRTVPAHRSVPAVIQADALVTDLARRHFADVAVTTDGDARGWDHHWWVTIIAERGLSTMPAVNLVENDGYGEGATHTRAAKDPEPAAAMPMPITHPAEVALNRDVEAELELILLRTDGRLARLARRLIRSLWLRSVVRRIMIFPPVWRLVRRFAR